MFWRSVEYASGYTARCKECKSRSEASVSSRLLHQQHSFTQDEQTLIWQVCKTPRLAGLLMDSLYRSDPKRWQAVAVAAMLLRREAGVA